MDVNELFRRLSVGELSNLSMSMEGNGSIEENHHQKLVLYINDGLKKLYGRFVLNTKDVLIEQVGHITNYHLLKRFAESNYNPEIEPYPYIKDRVNEPFLEDVIKILEVYDTCGVKLPLNDAERTNSLFIPQANCLQVPYPQTGVCLSVVYQAAHPVLEASNLDAEIELPEILEPALREFVAYKVYSHTNSQEATVKAQEHLSQYEATCTDAELKDLVSTSVATTNSTFEKRGWV